MHFGEKRGVAVGEIGRLARVAIEIEKLISVGVDVVVELLAAVDEAALRLVIRIARLIDEDRGRRECAAEDLGRQASTPRLGIGRQPREVEHGRHDVDRARSTRDALRVDAGHVDEERHAHDLVPNVAAMEGETMFAEGLAVIAGENDHGSRGGRRCRERLEHAADVEVGVGDLAVVEGARIGSEVRESGVLEVLLVRVEKMSPDEERPLTRSRDRSKT